MHVPRTHYIFIDFENVHETDLDRIAGRPVHVTMVLGGQHKNLPVSLVRKLLKYPGQIDLVEAGSGGKNALDMVLAVHVGSRRATDPKGIFHIIAKDRGYRAVVEHFQANALRAEQHASLSCIPILMTPSELCQVLATWYGSGKLSRPKNRKALESQIQSQLGSRLSEEEAKAIVVCLEQAKVIRITDSQQVVFEAAQKHDVKAA